MPDLRPRRTRLLALRRLADRVLEAPDLDALARLLSRELKEAASVSSVTLLLWDRKLDSFMALNPGETQVRALKPGEGAAPGPEARYLLSDGTVLETGGRGEGTLVPLMARSGLVGMLALGPSRRKRAGPPFSAREARRISDLATRAALTIENHLYSKELIASERMAALGTMAGMLAHDFRGPMTVIRGYAETLLESEMSAAEVRDRAELIVKMIDRLERMTSETLDFARGGGKLARRSLPLYEHLAELADGIAQEVSGLELLRDFQVPADGLAALDPDKLRRALGNVAANARDAMGGKGRLHFAARVEGERLVLELRDEGPGVPRELRDRLFEPFVTHGKKGGTGLGLAVARRFVEDHGGTIELLPEGPGARFRITLPLAPLPVAGAV